MFRVEPISELFEGYELADTTSGAVVTVAPGRGGIIAGFSLHERALLYLELESLLDPTRSVRGGIPILFPICSKLPDDSYTLNGETYTLKQHGLARLLPWEVVDSTTDGCASLTLKLTSDGTTRASYPFDFELRFTYQLAGERLTIRQEYDNHSAGAMPMYAGFHPYFACTDKSQLEFDLPASQYVDHEDGKTGDFSGNFPFDLPTIDWIFTDVRAQKASVTNRADGTRLVLEYDPIFRYLVFWTLAGKDFYCLEPWMAARNAMNTGEHLQHVPPGGCLSTEVSILGELL